MKTIEFNPGASVESCFVRIRKESQRCGDVVCGDFNGTMMHTKTYGGVAPATKVLKWIRPTYNQYLKLSPFTRQHIEQGGLILETMIED